MKEIVIIMGIQGSGKSTQVKKYLDQRYIRFNRDEMGGNLDQLNHKLEDSINKGNEKFVLDNTYGVKDSRQCVIAIGNKYNIPVKCVWMQTKIEDAQYNVSKRILNRYVFGKTLPYHCINDILGPNGHKLEKEVVPSIALYSYKKAFEEPTMDEGFSSIEKVKFVRDVFPSEYKNKAIILDYDGTLRETKSGENFPRNPDDVVILPNRKQVLSRYEKQGYILLGVSNQSGIEKGDLSESDAQSCFNRTNDLLGLKIDVRYCPHHSFPIRCFCRKPLPGLGVYFIEAYKLNPSECIMVGDSTSDKTFSQRCGFQFSKPEDFFK